MHNFIVFLGFAIIAAAVGAGIILSVLFGGLMVFVINCAVHD